MNREACRKIIEDFRWVGDESPLPVDIEDPQQLADALAWAREQIDRYENAEFVAMFGSDEYDEDWSFEEMDLRAVKAFAAAVKWLLDECRNRDRQLVAEWNAGASISGEPKVYPHQRARGILAREAL